MTLLTFPELLALDPVAAPDEAFNGWTLAQIEPIRARLNVVFDAACAFGYEAKTFAHNALAVFSLWIARAGAPASPDLDIASEHRRAEIAEMRILLQLCHYIEALLDAVASTPNPRWWPSLPSRIAANVHPHSGPTLPVFDVKAWAAARRELLLNTCRAPVVDGRVCVDGLDSRAQHVLREWERGIVSLISDQFEPVPGLHRDWKSGGYRH